MLSDEEFINSVWNKYENYICLRNKDDFFKKRIYKKNSNIIRNLSTAASFTIITFTAVGVCAGAATIYNYIQEKTTTDFNKNIGYDYSQDMNLSNNVYYKKIESYEEYKSACGKWNNLVEMSEEDFKTDFLIIVAGENYDTTSLTVKNIYNEDNNLYIDLIQTEQYNKDDTVLSIKLNRDLNKENVVINIIKENQSINSNFTSLDKLPKNYTKEEAIEDGCLVIEDNVIISNDNAILEKFIIDSNNNMDSSIRIAMYSEEGLEIKDLSYRNAKYYISEDNTRNGNAEIYYHSAEKLEKRQMKNGYTTYYLEDEIGNQTIICMLKK